MNPLPFLIFIFWSVWIPCHPPPHFPDGSRLSSGPFPCFWVGNFEPWLLFSPDKLLLWTGWRTKKRDFLCSLFTSIDADYDPPLILLNSFPASSWVEMSREGEDADHGILLHLVSFVLFRSEIYCRGSSSRFRESTGSNPLLSSTWDLMVVIFPTLLENENRMMLWAL